KPLWRL
uniref:Bradykinin-related peptide Pnor-3 n=1 Tax=Pithecopus nordestinus TaxID=2034992 RepID=BRK3_PITNO|nr:RecName: Full=Bradykinin-related peptide Pnor-3 [Pithecopus nordestinus]